MRAAAPPGVWFAPINLSAPNLSPSVNPSLNIANFKPYVAPQAAAIGTPATHAGDEILRAGGMSQFIDTPIGEHIAGMNADAILTAPGMQLGFAKLGTIGRQADSLKTGQASVKAFSQGDVQSAIGRMIGRGIKAPDVQSSIDPNQVIRLAEAMKSGSFKNNLMDSPVIFDETSRAFLSGNHRSIAAEMTGFELKVNNMPIGVPTKPLSEVPLQTGRVNPVVKTK
jgi:hypothetical protein